MKNKYIIALSLILCLAFGSIDAFAAAWNRDKLNADDPVITVTYTKKTGSDGYVMKMSSDRALSGVLDLNDKGYITSNEYTVAQRIDEQSFAIGWFSSDDDLYEARIIGETEPVNIPASSGIASSGTATNSWTVSYELIPTERRPARSEVTVVKSHLTTKKKITKRVYYSRGKKVSKKKFYARKPKGKKVKTSKKLLKTIKTLKKTELNFTDAVYEANEDNTLRVTYNFSQDRYYKVVKQYRKKYKY